MFTMQHHDYHIHLFKQQCNLGYFGITYLYMMTTLFKTRYSKIRLIYINVEHEEPHSYQ